MSKSILYDQSGHVCGLYKEIAMHKLAHWVLLEALLALVAGSLAHADEVTEWNEHMVQSTVTAANSPIVAGRIGAIVHVAVFDALNGIDQRYRHVFAVPAAPAGASRRAAVVQAAYASLLKAFPGQKAALDTKRAASMSAIAAATSETSTGIERGVEWGQSVADKIWEWRLTDGISPVPPAFYGSTGPGEWRSTPPTGGVPGAGLQFATMKPWVILSPGEFRPAAPPALDSEAYTADFEEVKARGSRVSSVRTADQELNSRFWAVNTPAWFWNQVARSLSKDKALTLQENARLFAHLNMAMADSTIGCWEAKYQYKYWRPISAITLAWTDGNSSTGEDFEWEPLLVTPSHPEYPSGHSCASGAAGRVLSSVFGDDTEISLTATLAPPVTRTYKSFSAALEDVKDARIDAGIHFRTACNVGQSLGIKVADYVLANALKPR